VAFHLYSGYTQGYFCDSTYGNEIPDVLSHKNTSWNSIPELFPQHQYNLLISDLIFGNYAFRTHFVLKTSTNYTPRLTFPIMKNKLHCTRKALVFTLCSKKLFCNIVFVLCELFIETYVGYILNKGCMQSFNLLHHFLQISDG
jgi:hypothetical protein